MSWAEGKLSVFVCFALACLFAEGLAWPGLAADLLCPAEARIKSAPSEALTRQTFLSSFI
jgi:hypothetical protein